MENLDQCTNKSLGTPGDFLVIDIKEKKGENGGDWGGCKKRNFFNYIMNNLAQISFDQNDPSPFGIFSQLQDQFFEISEIDLLIDALVQISNQCKRYQIAIDERDQEQELNAHNDLLDVLNKRKTK